MRGITEERLRALFDDYQHKFLYSQLEKMYEPHAIMNILHMLVDECTELNAWQPIDENTPKDKYILVYDPGYGQLVVIWLEFYNVWMTVFGRKLTHPPTHWQELPKDPK